MNTSFWAVVVQRASHGGILTEPHHYRIDRAPSHAFRAFHLRPLREQDHLGIFSEAFVATLLSTVKCDTKLSTDIYRMSWTYRGEPVTELPQDCAGFVYCIKNTVTGRMYIGKKLAKFKKTSFKTVKLKNGNKKRRRIRSKVDSDWGTYYGSSKELLEDVARLGPDSFEREILYFCASKAECSYIEAREQFSRRVLESNEYYNGHVQVRVHKGHINGKIKQ